MTDLKLFQTAVTIPQESYVVIPPDDLLHVKSNQKHEMILYQGHLFKQTNEITTLRWQAFYPEVKCVYICTHSKTKCNCKFIQLLNNQAKIINTHIQDTNHFVDPQNIRRYEFCCFARNEIKKQSKLYTSTSSYEIRIEKRRYNRQFYTNKKLHDPKGFEVEIRSVW